MNQFKRRKVRQWLLVACLVPVLMYTSYCCYNMYHDSVERAYIKDDFMRVNSIINGLFSVNIWREEIKTIISQQIEDFDLSPEQDSLLRVQISSLLNSMITEAQVQINTNDETLKKKLRKFAVGAIVDWEEIRKQVPEFTNGIMEDLMSEESKERLKIIAQSKLDEYSQQIYDDTLATYLNNIYQKYDTGTRLAFNAQIVWQTEQMQKEIYRYMYIILAIMIAFLVLWFFIFRFPELVRPFFIMSILLALIVLLAGLNSPMIEIDARINKVDFVLLGQHIEFDTQMLYYRSKSILQVVGLLLQSARFDSKLVGALVLAFSVILPISKLISGQVYLLSSGKIRHNKILYWLAFNSGKWSMADVMVVAIFMSYVGFDGIMDSQLEFVNVESETLTSIATNLTSLEPGFALFLAFVLFSMILSGILKKITIKKELPEAVPKGAGKPL